MFSSWQCPFIRHQDASRHPYRRIQITLTAAHIVLQPLSFISFIFLHRYRKRLYGNCRNQRSKKHTAQTNQHSQSARKNCSWRKISIANRQPVTNEKYSESCMDQPSRQPMTIPSVIIKPKRIESIGHTTFRPKNNARQNLLLKTPGLLSKI